MFYFIGTGPMPYRPDRVFSQGLVPAGRVFIKKERTDALSNLTDHAGRVIHRFLTRLLFTSLAAGLVIFAAPSLAQQAPNQPAPTDPPIPCAEDGESRRRSGGRATGGEMGPPRADGAGIVLDPRGREVSRIRHRWV